MTAQKGRDKGDHLIGASVAETDNGDVLRRLTYGRAAFDGGQTEAVGCTCKVEMNRSEGVPEQCRKFTR